MPASPLQPEHIVGAHLHADRDHLITSWAPKLARCRVAEVGVALGDFSERLISILDVYEFHAFDIFQMHQWPTMWGRPTSQLLNHRTHREYYESRFAHEITTARIRLFEGDSSDCLGAQPDAFYDLIYIDGAHDLDSVRKDADISIRKIKATGILVFNDYIIFDHLAQVKYGVVEVVNDLCVHKGWRISDLALHPEMFCDVALVHP